MKGIKCFILMIWTKDIQTLENKSQVTIFFILDIEEMSDV